MIITTSYNPNIDIIEKTKAFSIEIGVNYTARDKKSLEKIMFEQNTEEIVVVEMERVKYFKKGIKQPFFFHPSIAVLRINRLKQGDNDLMVQLANLKPGDSFLDCTLGMATDSLVASYIVGPEGRVVGLESQPIIAILTKAGLIKGWHLDHDIDAAMKRIEIEMICHYEYLKALPDNSFDIIYFDPMFRYGVTKSVPFNPIRSLANPSPITQKTIEEAKRVARRKVILKENMKSDEFERLGFKPYTRSSSITFGVISVSEVDYL